ncbi:MAG: ABC transporter permease [Candidatus Dadabacteria bacterium]|nr:MAG: ABC transporter permease [Candidatus Dadabacteria bacterium]
MKARLALLGYLAAVVAGTAVHEPAVLAGGLLLVLALAGRKAPAVLLRAGASALPFSAVVSAGYAALAAWRGEPWFEYVVLLNVRVLFLAALTVTVAMRVRLFEALSFSPALTYVLAIAYAQILTLRRLLGEFRLAHRSRSLRPAKLAERYRQSAACAGLLLEKSHQAASEITLGMRSRGFFDD